MMHNTHAPLIQAVFRRTHAACVGLLSSSRQYLAAMMSPARTSGPCRAPSPSAVDHQGQEVALSIHRAVWPSAYGCVHGTASLPLRAARGPGPGPATTAFEGARSVVGGTLFTRSDDSARRDAIDAIPARLRPTAWHAHGSPRPYLHRMPGARPPRFVPVCSPRGCCYGRSLRLERRNTRVSGWREAACPACPRLPVVVR